MSECFVGEIRPIGFTYAPVGWAMCNGQNLEISEYSTLFTLIGTTFGGNGQTNFNLPNLGARVTVHQGSNGVSNYSIGQMAGTEMVTLIGAHYPAHSHTLYGASAGTGANAPGGNVVGPLPNAYATATPNVSMNAGSLTAVIGGSQPHENRQPYLALNWIIALYGIFPST